MRWSVVRPLADDFASFYEAARDDCLRTVVVSVGDVETAEDLVAEAFARAWASWPRLRTHPALRAWVVRTALNLHVSVWRRRRYEAGRRHLVALAATDERGLDSAVDEQLLTVLRELPDRQRRVVALRILLDLDTAQTADVLGIAPGTVRAHLARALKHLRCRLPAPKSMEDTRG